MTYLSISMSPITTVAGQMNFLNRLEELGYTAGIDYRDSARENTITILSEEMAADPGVHLIFKGFGL